MSLHLQTVTCLKAQNPWQCLPLLGGSLGRACSAPCWVRAPGTGSPGAQSRVIEVSPGQILTLRDLQASLSCKPVKPGSPNTHFRGPALQLLPPSEPQTTFPLTSLSLNSLICKMEMMRMPTSLRCKCDDPEEALKARKQSAQQVAPIKVRPESPLDKSN